MNPSTRLVALLLVSWSLLAGVAARVHWLTVLKNDEYSVRAERRRRRVDFVAPRRGRIADAHGKTLAVDRPIEDVAVELTDLDPSLALVPALARATREKNLVAVARAVREAREAVRRGAATARVALAADELARDRCARLAARFPGLVCVPLAGGGFEVVAPAELLGTRDRALERLGSVLGIDPAALRSQVHRREDEVREIKDRYARARAWGEPLVLARDVSFDAAAAVEEASVELPGILVSRRFERSYPRGPLAAHLVGYVSAPSEAELLDMRKDGRLVDEDSDAGGLLLGATDSLPEGARLRAQTIGRTGLEAKLEAALSGAPGARVVERDAGDRSRTTLLDLAARDGEDVRLTIEAELQEASEAALDGALAKHGAPGAGGAAVLLELETGNVLALASAPRFDLNGIGQEIGGLLQDPACPLLHRAVEAVPPGSTFKALSAFAFFGGQGGLDPGATFECLGALVPGKKGFHCDAVHGSRVGLARSLEQSCNVFYFKSADAQGPDRLASWAGAAGFGRLASGSIPLERKGQVPDRDWKNRRLEAAFRAHERREGELAATSAALLLDPFGKGLAGHEAALAAFAKAERQVDWCERALGFGPGDVRNAAIGQGDLTATPLQVARLAALVAGGGRLARARILETDAIAWDEIPLDPRVLAQVREGLEGCPARGTASGRGIGLRELDVAGKTGTAERGGDRPNYAWFMGYYPASKPRIAFATLVDRTKGHGGDVCGPIARALIDAYARSRGEQPKKR